MQEFLATKSGRPAKEIVMKWVQVTTALFALAALSVITVPLTAQDVDITSLSGAAIGTFNPPVTDIITVTDDFAIADTQVQVTLTTTFMGDLTYSVTAPSSTTVTLHNQQGGSDPGATVNYNDQGITNGSVPWTLGFHMQPSGPGVLADFNAGTTLGDWTFQIDSLGTAGSFDSWRLRTFGALPPPPAHPPIIDSCVAGVAAATAQLTWVNNDNYDSINVYVNGVLEASIAGTRRQLQPLCQPQSPLHSRCASRRSLRAPHSRTWPAAPRA